MPFSISGLLSSRESDIGQRALTRGSIQVGGNSPEMEKGMLIYLSHISTLNSKE